MKRSSRLLLLVPLLAMVALGACGGSDGDDAAGEAAGDDGRRGTDSAFAALMVPHHAHALEMAELAVTKATRAETRDLAQRIIDTQQREITTLEGFLDTFGAEPAMPPAPAMELMEGQIEQLATATGAGFDRAFLKAMSDHHLSAIQMAEMEIGGGTFPAAVELAEEIGDTQEKEIAEMLGIMAFLG